MNREWARVAVSIFLAFTFSGQSVFSQQAVFNHLTADDGLTTNNVRAFCQDYQGFIWMGTEDGLHRYDGYSFKVYAYDVRDSTSIGGNFTMALYEDTRKQLWVGTLNNGLALYDRQKDSFYNFMPRQGDSTAICGNTISAFYESDNGTLWIASEQGAFCYIDLDTFDPANPVFHTISLPGELLKKGISWIRCIVPADSGKLWLSVHGAGLLLYDPVDGGFEQVLNAAVITGTPVDLRADIILKDTMGRVWFGTWGGGLYVYYPQEEKILRYAAGRNKYALPNNQVSSMVIDKSGNLWIGTDGGLARMMDFNDAYPVGKFEVYLHDDFDQYSISGNAIKPIFVDTKNRLWVASYFGGVNVYDPDSFRFRTIRNHPLKPGTLPHNNVTAIAEDKSGDLWVATDGGGLSRLNGGVDAVGTGNFEKIRLINSANNAEELKVKCLHISHDNTFWIGTWGGGMFVYDPKNKSTRHFGYGGEGRLPSESILSITEDKEGDIWIGTFNAGIARYNRAQDRFTYYTHTLADTTAISGNKINIILADSYGNIWAGVEGGGLNLYNRATDSFRQIHNKVIQQNANILTLFECSDHNLWVGMHTEGLARLNPLSGETVLFSASDDIPGKLIQSIVEDKQYFLWISTNNGIAKLIMKTKEVIRFSPEEGLQSKQFNQNSAWVSSSGKVLLGGVNGLNVFEPQSIKKSEYDLDIVFTEFRIGNELHRPGDSGSLLKKNITVADKIELHHYQNSFSIEYAALEYDFTRRTSYLVMLQGFDKDWRPKTRETRLTYTNLNPGDYTLFIRPINKDGFPSSIISSLKIEIKPAWYQTRLFLAGLAIFIITLAYVIVQLRINFFKQQNRKLEDKVRTRTQDLYKTNKEIHTRNAELELKNFQILEQQEELETARTKLEELNANLESLVLERTDKLEKTVAELDRFVYSASHDLSAPLKSILGLLNIARLDKDTTRTQEYLAYIQESIMKLEDVIKSLISYSRNSRLALDMENINLHDLIREIFDELQFLDGARRIAHSINIPPSQLIYSDRRRLKIVFHNLLNNAIKYADLEKPSPVIVVSLIDDGDHWIIEVHDNGIGIDDQFVEKVFGMFYRATERSKGSGLGLFIVSETVAVLGGKVFLDSSLGKESTFSVYLPKQIQQK